MSDRQTPESLSPQLRLEPPIDGEDLSRDTEFPDDISCLDHAPATSHGTYLAGTQDRVENLEDYQAGGYHPIHLGDHLGNAGRYRVIHKLGHGGFSTVWLWRAIARKGSTSPSSPHSGRIRGRLTRSSPDRFG